LVRGIVLVQEIGEKPLESLQLLEWNHVLGAGAGDADQLRTVERRSDLLYRSGGSQHVLFTIR